jgi:hypothetical protein
MALIYLRHPKHGVKIASLDIEAEHDEQYGWVRFDPNAQSEAVVVSENLLARKRKRVDDVSAESKL